MNDSRSIGPEKLRCLKLKGRVLFLGRPDAPQLLPVEDHAVHLGLD